MPSDTQQILVPYRDYLCRVQVREMYRGRPVLPAVKAINEAVLILHPGWLMGDDDLYPGEWTMLDSVYSEFSVLGAIGVSWLPEGDVEILCPIPNCLPYVN